jgi:hypothetical protein
MRPTRNSSRVVLVLSIALLASGALALASDGRAELLAARFAAEARAVAPGEAIAAPAAPDRGSAPADALLAAT